MKKTKKLSLIEVISMAVGTMIGASIFTIFSLGAEIAGKNLPEAFILSGIYALVVAYSYATLGGKIISNAGPIAFILKGLNTALGGMEPQELIIYPDGVSKPLKSRVRSFIQPIFIIKLCEP